MKIFYAKDEVLDAFKQKDIEANWLCLSVKETGNLKSDNSTTEYIWELRVLKSIEWAVGKAIYPKRELILIRSQHF